MSSNYDVLVIGGGICGTALFYQLARHTGIARIALLEKYDSLATVNSNARSNSQTLHCGDIETNYSFDKAKKVKAAADKLAHFAASLPDVENVMRKHSKMVLGVGDKEVAFLRDRYEKFKGLYPHMRLLEKAQVAEIEPNVALIDGQLRPDNIVALGSTDEYTEMNFGALAQAFADQALSTPGKVVEAHLSTKVRSIRKTEAGFLVKTNRGEFMATCVVVCAGAHSLLLAQSMGYGLHLSTLPVAGSFYYTPQVLNGKVYTVQNDKLPFAAIHGDPDILLPGKTRFGPTALVLPKLERYRGGTTGEFFRTLHFGPAVAKVLWSLIRDPDIRSFMLKNLIFEIPGLRRHRFLHDVRKIVPSLRLEDLEFAPGVGGVRPQIIDREQRRLLLGEAKIDPGTGIIFNMTPSPGATSCLDIAEGDARRVVELLEK